VDQVYTVINAEQTSKQYSPLQELMLTQQRINVVDSSLSSQARHSDIKEAYGPLKKKIRENPYIYEKWRAPIHHNT